MIPHRLYYLIVANQNGKLFKSKLHKGINFARYFFPCDAVGQMSEYYFLPRHADFSFTNHLFKPDLFLDILIRIANRPNL